MNHKIRRQRTGMVFTGLTALLLGVGALVVSPQAKATDVCATGFTTDVDYRAQCMREGTHAHAALAWYHGYSDAQRTQDCATGWDTGSMVTVVRETRGDELTDNFRNGEQVIGWTAQVAVENCIALGFGDVR